MTLSTSASDLFTVHNWPIRASSRTGVRAHWLDWNLYTTEGLEFYGQMNIMKGALLFSDKLNTVSPRYAEEIRTAEFGCGLEGVLRGRNSDLSGIINGLDIEDWDPLTDKHLP